MKLHHAAALAATIAPFAVSAFAVAVGAIQPRHVFGSPFLYVLLALSWFVGLPMFAALHPWLRLRLERYLLVGVLGIAFAWTMLAFKWGEPPPLNQRTLAWIIGHPIAGVLAFWATLRLLADDEPQT